MAFNEYEDALSLQYVVFGDNCFIRFLLILSGASKEQKRESDDNSWITHISDLWKTFTLHTESIKQQKDSPYFAFLWINLFLRAGLNRGVPVGQSTQIMEGNNKKRAEFRSGHIYNLTRCSALTPVQK